MYKYFINFLIFLASYSLYAQASINDKVKEKVKDSIVYKTNYGLRLGVDISKPIKGMLDDRYTGFEIVGDYRLTKNFYLAAEIGFEEETTLEDFTSSFSKGNYLRIGANINLYKNWLDMTNELFFGFRYGLSIFDQTLNSYSINTGNQYFDNALISSRTETGLNAHWTELMLGIKVETFKNVYLSASMSYKIMISLKEPDNFKTLFAPGFNRVFLSQTGFGFNYTISYTIPFNKK
ncbi:MAG: hypothetical protein JXQ93_09645 [Flavobacteriaceae bacterium]